LWLFFDQAFLRDRGSALSTFLLAADLAAEAMDQPVDKSVIKLWKDSDEGRGYWLAAIAELTARSGKSAGATCLVVQGQAKKFQNTPQSLVDSGLQLFHLPPECVDGPVDKVRAHGCKPRPL
jgi:hypothetical protein